MNTYSIPHYKFKSKLSFAGYIVGAVIFCLIIGFLAGTKLGYKGAFVLPGMIMGIYILLSVELTTYLIVFFIFTGIARGLELPGGFLLVTLFFIASWGLDQFLKKERTLYLDSNLFIIISLLLFLVISIIDAPWPFLSFSTLLVYANNNFGFCYILDGISSAKMVHFRLLLCY